jgi:hypothetical protein
LTCSSLNVNSVYFSWTNSYSIIWCGEKCLIVSWCVAGEYDMADNDKDRGRSRRLSAEDQGWSGTSQVLGGQTIGRSGDVVCDLHHTRGGDEKHRFSVLDSKLVATVCQWFSLKPTFTVFWFEPQNQGRQFDDLSLKNHRDCFLVCASKPSKRRFVSLRFKIDERMKTLWKHAWRSASDLQKRKPQSLDGPCQWVARYSTSATVTLKGFR